MKKYILVVVSLFVIFTCKSQIIHFNDVNFKNKLLQSSYTINISIDCATIDYYKIDSNNDGEIEVSEAQAVCRLNIPASNISDLTGIAYFINLKWLNCPQNNLTDLDISQLTQLEQLACYQNNISTLNLSTLTHLQQLFCYQNQITSLDFNHNPELTRVYCGNNQISSLNFSANPLFNDLGCRNNQLTSLNIKNGATQLFGSQTYLNECWTGNPNLVSICADDAEIPALQSFMSTCGVNTSGMVINSSCSMGVDGFLAGGVGVYPNPTKGSVFIDNSNNQYTKILVYNCLGQEVVTSFVLDDDKMVVDLKGLPDGIYLVKMLAASGTNKTVKVIKE